MLADKGSFGVVYASRMQYLVGKARTRSGSARTKQRQKHEACKPEILKPPLQFMERKRAQAEVYFVQGKLPARLLADSSAEAAFKERIERERKQEDERTKAMNQKIQLRTHTDNRDVALKALGALGVQMLTKQKQNPMQPVQLKNRLLEAASRCEQDGWETITEGGVTYWYNPLTGRYAAENPFPEEEPAPSPLGLPKSGREDAFAFLNNWAKYSNPEKLPALPPSSKDWYGEAPEYIICRHT